LQLQSGRSCGQHWHNSRHFLASDLNYRRHAHQVNGWHY